MRIVSLLNQPTLAEIFADTKIENDPEPEHPKPHMMQPVPKWAGKRPLPRPPRQPVPKWEQPPPRPTSAKSAPTMTLKDALTMARVSANRNPSIKDLQDIAYQNCPPRAEPWKLGFTPKAPGLLGLQGPTRAWALMGVQWAFRVSQNTPFVHYVWVEPPATTLRGSLGRLVPPR